MSITSLINKARNYPKSLIALIVIVFVGISMTATIGAANNATLEGSTTVLNVTAGETEYKDSTSLKVDEVAQAQVWLHNREAPGGQAANNTNVKITIPSEAGVTQTITGRTSSDNSNTVTDTATVNLSLDRARVEYVPGSAKFRYNKGAVDGVESCITGMNFPAESCYETVSISDDVVTTGVNLDKHRGGPLNGCNAYHETVIVQLRSVVEAISVNKYVRHLAEAGETKDKWSTSTTAEPGDELEYLITFKNEGNKKLEDVMVGDNLPKYNSYVPNTTMLSNGNNPSGISVSNNNVTKGGINTGDYNPGANANVWFTAKIDPITAFERCGEYEVVNVGVVRAKGMNEFYNTANVKINVECEEVPDPVYACDLLTVARVNENTYKFTVDATAENGATILDYRINPGDGSDVIVSANNMVEHTYSAPGTYTVEASVRFDVKGETKTVSSRDCKKKVTIEEEKEPFYACNLLTVQKVSDDTFRFTVDATAGNGATIVEYGFVFDVDNAPNDVLLTQDTTVEHTYNTPGTYNVAAIPVVSVNGELVPAVSENCVATVQVDEETETPVYTCDDLIVKLVKDNTYKLTVETTATNGATVKDYQYNFGDDTEVLLTDQNMVEHTYAEAGEYKAAVTVRFDVNGEVKTISSDDCMTKITFADEPQVEGETTTKPKTLPSTGAGSIAGAFAALTAAGAAGHNLVLRRRK